MNDLRIDPIDHRALPIATRLHAVHMAAYAVEAELLGASYFPPLHCTVDDLRAAPHDYRAAFIGREMVGAIAIATGLDEEGLGVNIASLVVAPAFHRRGVGRALMAMVLRAQGQGGLTVQTGLKNLPALALYAQSGFIEVRRWPVGREPLTLVKLRRLPEGGLGEGR